MQKSGGYILRKKKKTKRKEKKTIKIDTVRITPRHLLRNAVWVCGRRRNSRPATFRSGVNSDRRNNSFTNRNFFFLIFFFEEKSSVNFSNITSEKITSGFYSLRPNCCVTCAKEYTP